MYKQREKYGELVDMLHHVLDHHRYIVIMGVCKMDWTIWTSPKPSVYCLTHDLCTHPNPLLALHPYPLMGEPTQFYSLKGKHLFFAYLAMVNVKKNKTFVGDMTHGKDFFLS